MLGPVVDGLAEPLGHGCAAKDGCKGQDPLVLGLGPGGEPEVKDLHGQLLEISDIQPGSQLPGGVAAPDAAQLAVGEQNGVADVVIGRGAVGVSDRLQRIGDQPTQLLELVAFDQLRRNVSCGAHGCGTLGTQSGPDGIGDLGILFGGQCRFQSGTLSQFAQNLHNQLTDSGLFRGQEGFIIFEPFGMLAHDLCYLLPDLLGAVSRGGEDRILCSWLSREHVQSFQGHGTKEAAPVRRCTDQYRQMLRLCSHQSSLSQRLFCNVFIFGFVSTAAQLQQVFRRESSQQELLGHFCQSLAVEGLTINANHSNTISFEQKPVQRSDSARKVIPSHTDQILPEQMTAFPPIPAIPSDAGELLLCPGERTRSHKESIHPFRRITVG